MTWLGKATLHLHYTWLKHLCFNTINSFSPDFPRHTGASLITEPSAAFQLFFCEVRPRLYWLCEMSWVIKRLQMLLWSKRCTRRNKVMLLWRTYGRALGRWLWRSTKKRYMRSESLMSKRQQIISLFWGAILATLEKPWGFLSLQINKYIPYPHLRYLDWAGKRYL